MIVLGQLHWLKQRTMNVLLSQSSNFWATKTPCAWRLHAEVHEIAGQFSYQYPINNSCIKDCI